VGKAPDLPNARLKASQWITASKVPEVDNGIHVEEGVPKWIRNWQKYDK